VRQPPLLPLPPVLVVLLRLVVLLLLLRQPPVVVVLVRLVEAWRQLRVRREHVRVDQLPLLHRTQSDCPRDSAGVLALAHAVPGVGEQGRLLLRLRLRLRLLLRPGSLVCWRGLLCF
jgi:hypothetical protein